MDTDLFTQLLQYVLNLLPANSAADVAVVVTFIVTLCTLILRFWKEPKADSKWHGVWAFIHLVASFRLPQKQPVKGNDKPTGQTVTTNAKESDNVQTQKSDAV